MFLEHRTPSLLLPCDVSYYQYMNIYIIYESDNHWDSILDTEHIACSIIQPSVKNGNTEMHQRIIRHLEVVRGKGVAQQRASVFRFHWGEIERCFRCKQRVSAGHQGWKAVSQSVNLFVCKEAGRNHEVSWAARWAAFVRRNLAGVTVNELHSLYIWLCDAAGQWSIGRAKASALPGPFCTK